MSVKRSQMLKTTVWGVGGAVGVYNTVSHLCFFATLNKEQKSSYLQLCRWLNGEMLVFGFLYSKCTPIVNVNEAKKLTCQVVLPMPKFEANTNYIHPSPPSSMKQCNKSATVKFHMELLLMLPSNLLEELSFVTLTIHLCNGLNDKNFIKQRKTCFLTV